MSRVRVSVEWVFDDIANYFAFVEFKKKLKIGLSAVGKCTQFVHCLQISNIILFWIGPTRTRSLLSIKTSKTQ